MDIQIDKHVPPQSPMNLIQKLAKVMASIHTIPKSGRNSFHNYDYATEADINAGVRKGLAIMGVMIIPDVTKLEWREVQTKNGVEKIATMHVCYTVTDGNEERKFTVIGEGQDKGDKATYKAMTGAGKYALLKLFLISTGDDPEAEEEATPRPPQRSAPRQSQAPKKEASLQTAAPVARADLDGLMAKIDASTGDRAKSLVALKAAVQSKWNDKIPHKTDWTQADADDLFRLATDVPF